MGRRVVVTGRGVVSPLGVSLDRHSAALLRGRSAISKCERLSALSVPTAWVGEIPAEELEASALLIPRKHRKLMNRATVLAAIAAHSAAQEAGLGGATIEPDRLGVFLATWFTSYEVFSFLRYLGETESSDEPLRMDADKANRNWMARMNPLDYSLKVLPNLAAGHLAILHRAQGFSRLLADGWRGGLLAVAQAAETIRRGELDLALAGGSEFPLDEGIICDLLSLEVMARDGMDAESICRPFDSRRRGAVIGAGSGIVVLEERDHALRRGAAIYGEIAGSGSSAPGSGGVQQALCHSIKKAMFDARMSADEIDLIHANGDSTLENDRAEGRAIEETFGARGSRVPVTATKSLHGHLLSAAGAVELVSSLLMLEHGVVPPIANCDKPDPGCHLDLVRDTPRSYPSLRAILLNAVGLFGETASLLAVRG